MLFRPLPKVDLRDQQLVKHEVFESASPGGVCFFEIMLSAIYSLFISRQNLFEKKDFTFQDSKILRLLWKSQVPHLRWHQRQYSTQQSRSRSLPSHFRLCQPGVECCQAMMEIIGAGTTLPAAPAAVPVDDCIMICSSRQKSKAKRKLAELSS